MWAPRVTDGLGGSRSRAASALQISFSGSRLSDWWTTQPRRCPALDFPLKYYYDINGGLISVNQVETLF